MEDQFLTEEQIRNIIKDTLGELIPEITSKIDRRFEVMQESIQGSSASFLDELIADAEEFEGEDDEDEFEDENDEDDYEGTASPDPEVAALKRELDIIKRQSQQDREAREQAERDRQLSSMRSSALNVLQESGRIVKPEALLKLLEADGHLVERDGQYVVKGKDEYGDIYKPLNESIDTFLSGDYAYMATARGGTGTGATQGSTVSLGNGFKYFDRDGKSTVDPGEAMKTDRDGYLKELAQVQSAK
ncbi:hypothetical protein NIES2135_21010 [Leptolyngbya boryana NIES-2135]|uniref:Phage protein n=1 Tax=Leptolyngbya boryana NIES-2135 TaxID=1973484 RepID=A0A1Z4JF31_LEPBY|nr:MULTISPECIES: hypothetical protein [Leptolyngbya]BAY55278.1 hypothetical protein NIES2135_21010 [Leptolyngbya boryana NIES-2135]MBD2369362.1 hypothetical protein [Leptolyngbya sp. FACHB-161]MBD2375636.1 hypothetical protein [Leptolyngbya sp. FACHB-238]MBD2401691.1 hypothetical protein [Leptolyngbya sp. FACHB-239]MBD2406570.1 hypothetical protein [Leptolyngbya sp. FACHB-402]